MADVLQIRGTSPKSSEFFSVGSDALWTPKSLLVLFSLILFGLKWKKGCRHSRILCTHIVVHCVLATILQASPLTKTPITPSVLHMLQTLNGAGSPQSHWVSCPSVTLLSPLYGIPRVEE